MALQIDDIIDGKYQIVRLLGEGGMGAVYEGVNLRIHRKVAIKILHGNVAQSADAVQRFEREAQAAGRIGSKHIVEVLDLGDLPSGDRYMVMEFMEGESLADRIRGQGQLSPQELFPIATQLLEGLAAAHAAGIVHRDLKPDNVYLLPSNKEGQPDFVKILDFGISKFNSLGGEFSMTRTGAVMGTPYYMSPEQAKGSRDLDQRTDLYAVGVILYEGLSGRVPFNAETFNELLFKIVLEEPPPLAELLPGINPAFVELVSKAMARDAAQRFQTAEDFKAALILWSQRNSIAPLGLKEPTGSYGTSLPSSTVLAGTAGAWASTGPNTVVKTPPPTKKSKWAPLVVAALALLVAGGGIVFKLSSRAEEEVQAAAVRAEEKQRQAEAAARALEESAARERAAAERAAREQREAAQKLKEAEEARKKALALEQAEGKAAQQAAAKKPSAQSGVQGSAATTAAAKPVPEKKPETTSTGTTTSTGRSIRSTL